jgi:N-methylhydantoinase B/oxoprolinase/acetone carboxylase alpha subunit
VFKNAIFSIADEMALTVFRTTYSGVLKDNMDYSTGFADADGKLVAQGLTLPGHLGLCRRRWNRSCATTATTWPRATSSS